MGGASDAAGGCRASCRSGAWLPTDVEPDIVFNVPREQLWQRAYERIGASPIAFTSRTVGSA